MKQTFLLFMLFLSIKASAQNKGFYFNSSAGIIRYTNTSPLFSNGIGYSFGKHIIANNFEVSDIVNSNSNGSNSRRQRYWSFININYSYAFKINNKSYILPSVGFAPIMSIWNSRDEKAIVANNSLIFNVGIAYKIKVSEKLFFTSQLRIHPMSANFIYLSNGTTVAPASNDKMIVPISFLVGISK
jgi:hypothetical protein